MVPAAQWPTPGQLCRVWVGPATDVCGGCGRAARCLVMQLLSRRRRRRRRRRRQAKQQSGAAAAAAASEPPSPRPRFRAKSRQLFPWAAPQPQRPRARRPTASSAAAHPLVDKPTAGGHGQPPHTLTASLRAAASMHAATLLRPLLFGSPTPSLVQTFLDASTVMPFNASAPDIGRSVPVEAADGHWDVAGPLNCGMPLPWTRSSVGAAAHNQSFPATTVDDVIHTREGHSVDAGCRIDTGWGVGVRPRPCGLSGFT